MKIAYDVLFCSCDGGGCCNYYYFVSKMKQINAEKFVKSMGESTRKFVKTLGKLEMVGVIHKLDDRERIKPPLFLF